MLSITRTVTVESEEGISRFDAMICACSECEQIQIVMESIQVELETFAKAPPRRGEDVDIYLPACLRVLRQAVQ